MNQGWCHTSPSLCQFAGAVLTRSFQTTKERAFTYTAEVMALPRPMLIVLIITIIYIIILIIIFISIIIIALIILIIIILITRSSSS